MFESAFIQENGNGRLMPEAQLVREHCAKIGLPFQLYTPKRIARRQLPLTPRTFIFGDMDCMHGAMGQLKIPIPEARYYPVALTKYMHRRVWLETLGDVQRRISDGSEAVFAKPASRAKIFTGRVFRDHSDFYQAGETSQREPVWCSEVVSWQSEFRVYVVDDEIVATDHYAGDERLRLDAGVVAEAVADFRSSGQAPSAYGIDFGILGTGETALVEANDGYALGAYNIASEPYAKLLFTRWTELVAQAAA